MPKVFDLSATLGEGTTTSPVYVAKQTDRGIEGVVTVGPMPDPATSVRCLVQVSRDGGATWDDVGGLDATGGLTGPKGGPYTVPATAAADTFAALEKGWQVRGRATVANPPAGGLVVSFVGNTF